MRCLQREPMPLTLTALCFYSSIDLHQGSTITMPVAPGQRWGTNAASCSGVWASEQGGQLSLWVNTSAECVCERNKCEGKEYIGQE